MKILFLLSTLLIPFCTFSQTKDSTATFDFEGGFRLNYSGQTEDEIIKIIEGDTSRQDTTTSSQLPPQNDFMESKFLTYLVNKIESAISYQYDTLEPAEYRYQLDRTCSLIFLLHIIYCDNEQNETHLKEGVNFVLDWPSKLVIITDQEILRKGGIIETCLMCRDGFILGRHRYKPD